MRLWALFVVATLGVAGTGAPAWAQPSEQDKVYLAGAHQSNLSEIAVGKLAQQKATAQVVKELADRLITDHTRLDEALLPVARQFGVSLPLEPNDEQKAVIAQLQATASGPDFDKLWISTQLAAHDKAVAAGKTEITSGSDPAVKKLANDAMPVIAGHHEALMRASSDLGSTPIRVDGGSGGFAADTVGGPGLAVLLAAAGVLLIGGGLMLRRRKARVRVRVRR